MAALTGEVRIGGTGGAVNVLITSELNSYAQDYWPAYASEQLSSPRGTLTSNLPVSSPGETITGRVGNSYRLDYYDRVHFTPQVLNFGNILERQTRQVYVWNAWLTSSTVNGQLTTDSLVYLDPLPGELHALEEVLTYCIALPGGLDNLLDDSISLQFDERDDAVLPVFGTRVAVLPYQPKSQWQETHEWMTNVITSYNGSEQRVKLRTLPRITIDAEYPIPPSELQRANNIVYGWVRGPWAIPLWTDATLASPVVSGATTITLNDVDSLIQGAAEVFIWQSYDLYETVQVDSFAGNVLTTMNPVANNYSRPIVIPLVNGTTNTGIVRNTDGFTSDIKSTYRLTKQIAVEGIVPAQYAGHDIYFDEQLLPNSGNVTEDMLTRFDEVTNRIANSRFITPWANTKQSRIYTVYNRTKSETYEFKKWLARRSGKFRSFWTPSFEPDFILTQTGSITDALVFKSNGYDLYASAREHIAVKLTDGNWLTRRVTSYQANPDNTTSIGLNASLDIDRDEIEMVCYLGLKRLDTDRVELYYPGNGQSFASLRIVEISP